MTPTRSIARALAALALAFAAPLLTGCGESAPTTFKDPNELPPINADAAGAAQAEMDAVADAERAEAAKLSPSRPNARR